MTDEQVPLFTKVIDIRVAKKNKNGQQNLLEKEERYIPYSVIENSFQQMNAGFSEQQAHLTNKVDRLTNTLEKLVPEFEMGISGEKAHIYVDILNSGKKADLATIESSLPSEICYAYTTAELGQLINLYPSRLGTLFKKAGISGNPKFHHSMRTGLKGTCQKYKLEALDELYIRAKQLKFEGMKLEEFTNLENYLSKKEILV